MSAGIYAQGLGSDFERLQPELKEYFSLEPGSGHYGVGQGIFDIAGCPQPWLRPLLRLSTEERAFFPEYGTQIPFRVENHAHLDPFGRPSLTTRRELDFPGQRRVFENTTSLLPAGLVDYLGRHRRIVTDLAPSVEADGTLRAISQHSRLFLGRWRLRLPVALDAKAYARQWWDRDSGQHRIQVKVIHPQLGVILLYAGGFDYELHRYPSAEAAAHGVPSSLPSSVQPSRWEVRS
ncbi:hypothetical protein FHU41_001141 [Psychromicrobium silvestre]|uniref:DUF4166 domain-containing protein n=1 Tax=Psychromicrobium silvestre TaxID=1645614 RepID=A0A7Y9LST6_9MICC|nr:hypothetical protein [Psychromicrobium silvestre]